jgi:hypothetical protein
MSKTTEPEGPVSESHGTNVAATNLRENRPLDPADLDVAEDEDRWMG